MDGSSVYVKLSACSRLAADPHVPAIASQWAMDRLEHSHLIGETDQRILSELAFSYNAGLMMLYADLGDRR
jgi:hypothetical protein